MINNEIELFEQTNEVGISCLEENENANDSPPPAELEFKNITITVGDKKILDDISGKVAPGEVLALMGPSGSGKTTLLNYLSCRHELLGVSSKNISGIATINKKIVTKSDKRRIGYVMQNDMFFPTLSLKETLMFYTKVRLPDTMKIGEKIELMMKLVTFFNLENSLKTLIGGNFIKGLSGGEIKRTSVIVEMLTNPEILFLDEPTTGLDSNMAMSLIGSLRKLADHTKKTIIASIHMPSSQIFFSFSTLLLVVQGKLGYFGPTEEISSFFDSIYFPCPENWNIADHMIEMARSTPESIDAIVDGFKNREVQKHTPESATYEPINDENHNMRIVSAKKIKNVSSLGVQLEALTKRNFLVTFAETFTFVNLIQYISISLVVGIIFFRTEFSDRNFQTFLGFIFFMSVYYFEDSLFMTIFSFAPELMLVKKERMSGIYQLGPYYISKFIGEIPILVIRSTLIWIIVYFMVGLSYTIWFLPSLFHVYLVALHAQAIGLSIASIGLPQNDSLTIAILYYIVNILIGGLFNNDIPKWLSWIKYLSPFHYSYVIQTWIQLVAFGGLRCLPGIPNSAGFVPPSIFEECRRNMTVVSPEVAIKLTGADIHPGYYIIITVVSAIIHHVLSFFQLKNTIARPTYEGTIDDKFRKLKIWDKFKREKKQHSLF